MTELVNLVTLTPVDPAGPPLRFHLVGDDEVSGGLGGWEDVPRPRRRTAQEWTGVDGWVLGLPLLTSGHDVSPRINVSIEPKIEALIRLGYKVPGGSQPPVLEVTGPVRVPFPGMRWVLKDIDWGEQTRRSDGQRVQQEMTVWIKEYVAADVLLGPVARAMAGLR